jgi:hypothetical protein
MGRTSIFELDVDTLFRAGALFTARGFSYSTIKALVLAGIDAPERLLFADEADLRSIARLDEVALEEIARYRAEFAGPQRHPTWRPVFNGLGGIFVSAAQQKPQTARRHSRPHD